MSIFTGINSRMSMLYRSAMWPHERPMFLPSSRRRNQLQQVCVKRVRLRPTHRLPEMWLSSARVGRRFNGLRCRDWTMSVSKTNKIVFMIGRNLLFLYLFHMFIKTTLYASLEIENSSSWEKRNSWNHKKKKKKGMEFSMNLEVL